MTAEANDPCLTGEVNRYRKEIRAAQALRDLEAETQAWTYKIAQEREVMEKVLKESMRRLEQAGVYEELLHCSRAATPLPFPPHTMPLLLSRSGLVISFSFLPSSPTYSPYVITLLFHHIPSSYLLYITHY